MTRKIVALWSLLTLILLLRLYFFYHSPQPFANGQEVTITTTLLSAPLMRAHFQQMSIQYESAHIIIVAPLYPQFFYGQSLVIKGTVQNASPTSTHKTGLTMYYPDIQVGQSTALLAAASLIRQKVVSLFQRILPVPSSGLLLGIVFGIRPQFEQSFQRNLQAAGVMHVVAASGMNVSLVAGFLSSMFLPLFRRHVALIFSVVGIFLYVGIAGFEPSILRAAIMAVFAVFGELLGRQRLASYSLFLTAFLMLFVSPQFLNDIGFELSFLSTLGLIFIKPLFDRTLLGYPSLLLAFGKGEVTTTLAAQIATLPILLSFGSYSLWSIVINALVLWTIPILMIFGMLGAVVGLVFEPLASLILYLSYPFLWYFERIIGFFGAFLPHTTTIEVPFLFTIGYYVLLGGGVLFFHQRVSKKERIVL